MQVIASCGSFYRYHQIYAFPYLQWNSPCKLGQSQMYTMPADGLAPCVTRSLALLISINCKISMADNLPSKLDAWDWYNIFLAATKQLYKWYFPSVCLSVCPSVCLSHLFHHVPIIVSSWNFQELLPWSKVMSMQKFKVKGQRSRSQRSTPNLAVSGL